MSPNLRPTALMETAVATAPATSVQVTHNAVSTEDKVRMRAHCIIWDAKKDWGHKICF